MQQIRGVNNIEISEINTNRDTGEASRTITLTFNGQSFSLMLIAPNNLAPNLKILDYELKKLTH